jgi:hypothetical protein
VRGWTGQFETDYDAHENANKIPRAFLQYDYPEWALEKGIPLPLPQRDQFTPNFQQYEIAKDSCRRAIQAAMGISPLPTAAQRDSEKSGVALDHISTQEAIGSLHFGAGYDRAVSRAGRIIDSWMSAVYDNEREEWLHKADEKRRRVVINTDEPYPNEETGEAEHFQIGNETHDVSVSTGPAVDSQRDAVNRFLDSLIANLGKLPIAPPAAAKLLALAVQMKDLGPKGDQMAEIISPSQPENGQQLQGLQQQVQQGQALLQQMQGELQQLRLEKQGRVVDNEYKLQLERMRLENQMAIAEINTKAQALSERLATFSDMMSQFHSQAHETGMQADQQAHQEGMASQARDAASAQQAASAAQQPGTDPGAGSPSVQQ